MCGVLDHCWSCPRHGKPGCLRVFLLPVADSRSLAAAVDRFSNWHVETLQLQKSQPGHGQEARRKQRRLVRSRKTAFKKQHAHYAPSPRHSQDGHHGDMVYRPQHLRCHGPGQARGARGSGAGCRSRAPLLSKLSQDIGRIRTRSQDLLNVASDLRTFLVLSY